MVSSKIVCVLLLFGLVARGSSSGLNAMLDYYLHETRSLIEKAGMSTIDASPYVGSLPSDAWNPLFYDLTSLQRQGDVILNVSSSSIYLEASVGFSNLVFQAWLRHKILFFTLTGGLRMHLTDNGVTVGLNMDFNDSGCTVDLAKVVAKLDGMYVDVWGMTQIGDDQAKGQVWDLYNAHKAEWENQIVSQIKELFNEEKTRLPALVCSTFIQTVRQMDDASGLFQQNRRVIGAVPTRAIQ